MGIAEEKGVSNHETHRKISDTLDKIPGFKESKTRNKIHEYYHNAVGKYKELNGNKDGAKKEYKRADEHRNLSKKKSNEGKIF